MSKYSVGGPLDHIESKGLLENTLFIYLSDNGWEQGLSERRPDLVAEFRKKIAAWKQQVGMRERIDIHE